MLSLIICIVECFPHQSISCQYKASDLKNVVQERKHFGYDKLLWQTMLYVL